MNNEESSLLKDLPKGHPDRNTVAEQITKARKIDRYQSDEFWVDYRSGVDYTGLLQGLEATFDYVRNLGKTQTVLDIGTGTARGISEISQSSLGNNLKFIATSLTSNDLARQDLGQDNFKITMAESLRGIPDKSVDCVLAVHSISYSAIPSYVVASINRVLSDDGIIKAVFRNEDASAKLEEKRAEEFTEEFRKLGYKVGVFHPPVRVNGQRKRADLLIAVKSSGDLTPEIIYASDRKNLTEQLDLLG